jgi:hypothetical protein
MVSYWIELKTDSEFFYVLQNKKETQARGEAVYTIHKLHPNTKAQDWNFFAVNGNDQSRRLLKELEG